MFPQAISRSSEIECEGWEGRAIWVKWGASGRFCEGLETGGELGDGVPAVKAWRVSLGD